MPRSFSSAFESMTRSGTTVRASNVPDCLRSWSTSVVLPWSTCAMIAMLRSVLRGVRGHGGGAGGQKGAEYTGKPLRGRLFRQTLRPKWPERRRLLSSFRSPASARWPGRSRPAGGFGLAIAPQAGRRRPPAPRMSATSVCTFVTSAPRRRRNTCRPRRPAPRPSACTASPPSTLSHLTPPFSPTVSPGDSGDFHFQRVGGQARQEVHFDLERLRRPSGLADRSYLMSTGAVVLPSGDRVRESCVLIQPERPRGLPALAFSALAAAAAFVRLRHRLAPAAGQRNECAEQRNGQTGRDANSHACVRSCVSLPVPSARDVTLKQVRPRVVARGRRIDVAPLVDLDHVFARLERAPSVFLICGS